MEEKVHGFRAGDRSHGRTEEIYSTIEELMEEIAKLGYVALGNEMLLEAGEKQKREALRHHREKLALAFGLVNGAAPPGKALRSRRT